MNEAAPLVALLPYEDRWLSELVPMWRASFETGVGVIDPHSPDAQRRYFETEVLPRNAVRVAWANGALVGFVAASDEDIAQLYVRVGWQRCGIGSRLLDWAKAQSCGTLRLFTFARNRHARTFYQHHGFVAIAHGFEPFWQLADVRYEWQSSPRAAT